MSAARLLAIATLAMVAGCSKAPPAPVSTTAPPPEPSASTAAADDFLVGGLYSMRRPDGSYVVAKVLAIDEQAVHLRSYANTFMAAPTEIDPAVLTLGGVDHPDGFGIGHYPVTRERFREDGPVFIRQVPVLEEELVGYRYWQRGEPRSRSR